MIAFARDGLDPRSVLAIVAKGAGGLGQEAVPARPAFAGNPPKILDEEAQFRWVNTYRFGHEGDAPQTPDFNLCSTGFAGRLWGRLTSLPTLYERIH
jgi:hypothetical protein